MIDSRGVSVALSEEPRRRHVMDQTESGDAPGDVSAAVEPKAEWGGGATVPGGCYRKTDSWSHSHSIDEINTPCKAYQTNWFPANHL